MPKTINITDTKTKEVIITETGGKYTLSVLYSLMDLDSKEYSANRVVINDADLTATEKTKLGQILSGIAEKIKLKEKI